ncbi:MAG: hypothetical protein BGO65_06895 [Afipia sp. 64-13]|nr:MAG: hypothetical protein BGO65_06895 [Afipia sp. 64-13]
MPPGSPSGRRKRPGPTIDLEATEISEPAVSEVSEPASAPEEATAAPPENETPPAAGQPRAGSRVASLLLSALTGAATAALLVGGAYVGGWLDGPERTVQVPVPDSSATQALASRLDRLESNAANAAKAPAAATPDPALTARLAALESALGKLRGDLDKTRAQNDETRTRLEAVAAAPRAVLTPPAPAPDLSGIEQRLAQLDRATAALKSEIPSRAASQAGEKAWSRLAAATWLEQAARQGAPFAEALTTAKSLSDDPAALAPLEPFAAQGVPTAKMLSRDLLALLPALAPKADARTKDAPAPAAASGNILDRLQHSAAGLVRVHRVDDAASERTALIARVSALAQRDDIVEARRVLMTLPEGERAGLRDWFAKLDAREAALAAAHGFAQAAMASLAQATSPRSSQ